jgi:RHS repeat-associated protein
MGSAFVPARGVEQVPAARLSDRLPPKSSLSPNPLPFSVNPSTEELLRARVFAEPLVPVGGEPDAADNAAVAAALVGYANRGGLDDFSSLTQFLQEHPRSCWRAAVLTGLGIEYYRTAHYSMCLDAWRQAWALAPDAKDAKGKGLCDRAGAELAGMYARLGRMDELKAFFESANGRTFIGSSGEKINEAREGLWMMEHRPEIAFRCGPLALQRIKQSVEGRHAVDPLLDQAASSPQGCSLAQVADFSKQAGMNFQPAFRQKEDAAFVVPSVVHWKVGHYAALVRQEGDRYLLQDPTFRGNVWATRQALQAEASGYFLVPPGPLPEGWRPVETKEAGTVWGKGYVGTIDPGPITPRDPKKGPPICNGMMAPYAHLSTVNLSLVDTPLAYVPPVGPPVKFTVRYNYRDILQVGNPYYANLSAQWTCDWFSYINDNPQSLQADVTYAVGGGGYRTFTDFNTNTQTFDYEQYDQTLLTRISTNPICYQLLSQDGSKLIFSQSDGSVGTSRNVFLTQIVDPQGNALTLNYDANLLLVSITDAIGQVTTLTYGVPASGDIPAVPYLLTKVTDPFGRSATINYSGMVVGSLGFINEYGVFIFAPIAGWALSSVTDEIGMTSQVDYGQNQIALQYPLQGDTYSYYSYLVNLLITPYGTNTFNEIDGTNDLSRLLETVYPDGSRDGVEFNESPLIIPGSDAPSTVPQGMNAYNGNLVFRNTFYWSRNASAQAFGDYTKARIFHWLHSDQDYGSAIPESTKEPLENRVWYDYAGQSPGAGAMFAGANNLPTHAGRVLDDGSTQLFTFAYNGFGHITNLVDPVGRTFSYLYDTNGIDLLKILQTRGGANDLLFQAAYNSQHRPLTTTDAAGQTTTYTYNALGEMLTVTDPKNETTTFTYDTNGYLLKIAGSLPGSNDTVTATYDAFGRLGTVTDVSGYTLAFNYDALDRVTRVIHPDGTAEQVFYNKLDVSSVQDRAGRVTQFRHDSVRELTGTTDPLGRITTLEWCGCGALKALTDPVGRTTTWLTDVQGRRIAKQYADGSQVNYSYESTTSRLRQIMDEQHRLTLLSYNRDNTISSVDYGNNGISTPTLAFTYDPYYKRILTMSDGVGTTLYSYIPLTVPPVFGAGRLASVSGPLPNDAVSYSYDVLGRPYYRNMNGNVSTFGFDSAGRVIAATNALGSFGYSYDGASERILSVAFPNGVNESREYGTAMHDFVLENLTYQGTDPISTFTYTHDVPAQRIASWSQQIGTQPPNIYSFVYDAANQLLSAIITNSGLPVNTYAYSYDLSANRLNESIGGVTAVTSYNVLNQPATLSSFGTLRTNQWDAAHRLAVVTTGNQQTELSYDGLGRLAEIRLLLNGQQVTNRLFVWDGPRLSEEHDNHGTVIKRFFAQGVQLLTGTNAGVYYYTKDHLRSIRELTDASQNVRARYSYDPFGRRTQLSGDLTADFGFAGMFWSPEANLSLTHFRAYDAGLGRWLSRDLLTGAEMRQGPNLYAYVGNEPVGRFDPEGLAGTLPGLGFNTLTIGLATAAATEPGAVQELLVEIGDAAEPLAGAVEGLAVDAQAAAIDAGGAVASCVQTAIGYAGGPVSTAVEYADTLAPKVVQTVQSLAPVANNVAEDVVEDATELEWGNAWLQSMLQYREPLLGDLLDAEGNLTAEGLARWEETSWILNRHAELFGVPW